MLIIVFKQKKIDLPKQISLLTVNDHVNFKLYFFFILKLSAFYTGTQKKY